MPDNGWEASARAWIADMGSDGDFSRRHVLDGPMLARVRASGAREAVDVGCGEGRFCRLMRAEGIDPIGVEPTADLRATAAARDPGGRYLDARAEALPLDDASTDLVVSYLTLIDIDGLEEAVAQMARILRPGGRLLIANLNSFSTAGTWRRRADDSREFVMNGYADPRTEWVSWRGITVRNWHRPFQTYLQALLGQGLVMTHFEEPQPTGGPPETVRRFRDAPWFHVMEWRKPITAGSGR